MQYTATHNESNEIIDIVGAIQLDEASLARLISKSSIFRAWLLSRSGHNAVWLENAGGTETASRYWILKDSNEARLAEVGDWAVKKDIPYDYEAVGWVKGHERDALIDCCADVQFSWGSSAVWVGSSSDVPRDRWVYAIKRKHDPRVEEAKQTINSLNSRVTELKDLRNARYKQQSEVIDTLRERADDLAEERSNDWAAASGTIHDLTKRIQEIRAEFNL